MSLLQREIDETKYSTHDHDVVRWYFRLNLVDTGRVAGLAAVCTFGTNPQHRWRAGKEPVGSCPCLEAACRSYLPRTVGLSGRLQQISANPNR